VTEENRRYKLNDGDTEASERTSFAGGFSLEREEIDEMATEKSCLFS
jgi:hypothetical protein